MAWNNEVLARAEGLAERSGAGPEPGQSIIIHPKDDCGVLPRGLLKSESIILLHSGHGGARPPQVPND